MRDLAELNINEGGKPVTRPPPRDEDFDRFESRYRVSIPGELRMLLRKSNGGHPELDSVTRPDGSADHSINRFYYLDDQDGQGSLSREMADWSAILGPHALPFASDGGGNPFFVDLTTGWVKICLHDQGMAVAPLAPSFEAFLDSLDVDPDAV